MPLSSLVEPRISSSRDGISKSRAKKRGKLMMSGGTANAIVSSTSSSQINSTNTIIKSTGRSIRVPSVSQSVPSSPSLSQRDLNRSQIKKNDHDDMDLVRGIIFNHHRQDNLLCDSSSIGVIHKRSYSQGLPSQHQKITSSSIHPRQIGPSSQPSILKNTSRTAPSTPLKSKVKNVDPSKESITSYSKGETLTRSNSLENVRRKSYISAVLSPAAIDHPFDGTHFYNQTIHGAKSLPKNPPPPVPVTNSIAKRPLPPTPSLNDPVTYHQVSSSSSSQCQDATFKIPSSDINTRKRYDSGQSTGSNGTVDISSRAVRSSLVRTPVGITISTNPDSIANGSSNGIMTNICTESINNAHSTSSCTSQLLHDSHNANTILRSAVAVAAFSASANSTCESPIPSPILKGRGDIRSRAFSGSISGTTGILTDLSDSVTQLSSSHSCCSSRSASNAPSPTPSSASTLALQQLQQQQLQQNSNPVNFTPALVNCTYANEIVNSDVTNLSPCNLLPSTLDLDLPLPQQVKEVSSTMANTASANSSIYNSNVVESMPPPISLPPRKPKKSHNVPRTVISPINCTLAESVPIPKAPLTPMSVVSSQTALDQEVEATFTNAAITQTTTASTTGTDATSNLSNSRSCIETPRPDPIPILPHVKSGMMDVVSVGTYTPQWEEEKPFEFSDFIKYSAKHRAAKQQTTTTTTTTSITTMKNSSSTSQITVPSPIPTAQYSNHSQGAISHLNQINFAESSISPTTIPVEQSSNVLNESFLPDAPPVSGEFNSEMIDWYDERLSKPTVV